MLAMADTPISQYLPLFAELGIPVAFLVPTPTGYKKAIMDATAPVRELLFDAGLHNYQSQLQGQENKKIVDAAFVFGDRIERTTASLYRPVTKHGDPRIWFSGLKKYCTPCNLLALIILDHCIYVFDLSRSDVIASLNNREFVYEILKEAVYRENRNSAELLRMIKDIHNAGFIPSVTPGDPGVGDTLEHALGIQRNNIQAPDYLGIELKATRITRHGKQRSQTRKNLFTKVPDEGMTYRQILDNFGKWQIPRGETVRRFQLYETCRVSRPNAYGLLLGVDEPKDKLNLLSRDGQKDCFVSAWNMHTLRETLLTKHPETFWVEATSVDRDGQEYFRYDRILHTKNPNASLFAPLLQEDKITVDLAAHYKEDHKYRDHGVLFKMEPEDIHLLLGEETIYNLDE